MAIPSFYHPSLTEHDSIVNLDPAEASHAVKARRLKLGQEVRLFNGLGLVSFGELAEVDRRSAAVKIYSHDFIEASERCLSIAVAIPKGDRQKVMLDMLTQLSVAEIIPLSCDYSVTKFSQNMFDKWQRVTVEAAKQSQNPYLPVISKSLTVSELVAKSTKSMVVANAGGSFLLDLTLEGAALMVLIGPEGGFSDAEFNLFKSSGVGSIRLGGHILRTEAAAIAVASQFNLIR